jgi:hypothetical protein
MAVFALPARAIEPEHELGTWIGATSSLRYSDKWSLFLQGELRTWEFADNFNELLWRVAGHYDVNPKNMLAFGYVRVDTWPYTDEGLRKFYENRTYQEYLHKLPLGWGKLKNRFRLEQRWISTSEYGTEYSNRFRWKIGYTHQLKNREGGASKWYLTALNEIFIDFDNNGYWFNLNGFDKGLNQNRLYLGGGRKTGPLAKLQIGLLWQHRPEADFVRFVLGYSHNFDFRGGDN